MPNWEIYAEADKRGILPPEKKSLYDEAVSRGLTGAIPPERPDDTITHEETPFNQMDFAREQMRLTREKGQKGFQSDLVGLLKMFAQPTETGRQTGAAN